LEGRSNDGPDKMVTTADLIGVAFVGIFCCDKMCDVSFDVALVGILCCEETCDVSFDVAFVDILFCDKRCDVSFDVAFVGIVCFKRCDVVFDVAFVGVACDERSDVFAEPGDAALLTNESTFGLETTTTSVPLCPLITVKTFSTKIIEETCN
jgi:hypothetical protein